MRSLCLLALSATFLGSCALAAPTVWCDGNAQSANTFSPTTAGAYTVTDCTLTGLVSISGASIPASPGEGVDVLVTGSICSGTSSALQILGPSLADSPTLCPFRVTVRGNTFSDGIFRVQGSLPPHSYVTFEGNTMSLGARNTLTGYSSLAGLISIASPTVIELNENSTLRISDNSLVTSVTSANIAMVGLSSITLKASSSVKIERNSFNHGSTFRNVYGISIETLILTAPNPLLNLTGNFSAFLADENTFNFTADSTTAYAFSANSFRQAAEVKGAVISVSGNAVESKQGSSSALFIVGTTCEFEKFVFTNNRISASANALLSLNNPVIKADGILLISNNSFTMVPLNDIINYFMVLTGPTIGQNASVFVTCNAVDAQGISGSGVFFSILGTLPTTTDQYILYSGNTFSWLTSAPSAEEQFPSDIVPNTMEITACPQWETTIEATTTSQTTIDTTTTAILTDAASATPSAARLALILCLVIPALT